MPGKSPRRLSPAAFFPREMPDGTRRCTSGGGCLGPRAATRRNSGRLTVGKSPGPGRLRGGASTRVTRRGVCIFGRCRRSRRGFAASGDLRRRAALALACSRSAGGVVGPLRSAVSRIPGPGDRALALTAVPLEAIGARGVVIEAAEGLIQATARTGLRGHLEVPPKFWAKSRAPDRPGRIGQSGPGGEGLRSLGNTRVWVAAPSTSMPSPAVQLTSDGAPVRGARAGPVGVT